MGNLAISVVVSFGFVEKCYTCVCECTQVLSPTYFPEFEKISQFLKSPLDWAENFSTPITHINIHTEFYISVFCTYILVFLFETSCYNTMVLFRLNSIFCFSCNSDFLAPVLYQMPIGFDNFLGMRMVPFISPVVACLLFFLCVSFLEFNYHLCDEVDGDPWVSVQ